MASAETSASAVGAPTEPDRIVAAPRRHAQLAASTLLGIAARRILHVGVTKLSNSENNILVARASSLQGQWTAWPLVMTLWHDVVKPCSCICGFARDDGGAGNISAGAAETPVGVARRKRPAAAAAIRRRNARDATTAALSGRKVGSDAAAPMTTAAATTTASATAPAADDRGAAVGWHFETGKIWLAVVERDGTWATQAWGADASAAGFLGDPPPTPSLPLPPPEWCAPPDASALSHPTALLPRPRRRPRRCSTGATTKPATTPAAPSWRRLLLLLAVALLCAAAAAAAGGLRLHQPPAAPSAPPERRVPPRFVPHDGGLLHPLRAMHPDDLPPPAVRLLGASPCRALVAAAARAGERALSAAVAAGAAVARVRPGWAVLLFATVPAAHAFEVRPPPDDGDGDGDDGRRLSEVRRPRSLPLSSRQATRRLWMPS